MLECLLTADFSQNVFDGLSNSDITTLLSCSKDIYRIVAQYVSSLDKTIVGKDVFTTLYIIDRREKQIPSYILQSALRKGCPWIDWSTWCMMLQKDVTEYFFLCGVKDFMSHFTQENIIEFHCMSDKITKLIAKHLGVMLPNQLFHTEQCTDGTARLEAVREYSHKLRLVLERSGNHRILFQCARLGEKYHRVHNGLPAPHHNIYSIPDTPTCNHASFSKFLEDPSILDAEVIKAVEEYGNCSCKHASVWIKFVTVEHLNRLIKLQCDAEGLYKLIASSYFDYQLLEKVDNLDFLQDIPINNLFGKNIVLYDWLVSRVTFSKRTIAPDTTEFTANDLLAYMKYN